MITASPHRTAGSGRVGTGSATASTSDDGAPRASERFTPAEVPCRPDALNEALWLLRHSSNGSDAVRPWVAALMQAIPDEVSDADELHRLLLRTRRSLAPRGSSDLDSSLRQVRRHSSLYTPRSCSCLRRAWEAYLGRLGRLLMPVSDLPWGTAWLVTCNGEVQADRHGALTVAAIGRVLRVWHDEAPAIPAALTCLEVQVGTGVEGHPLVTVLWGQGAGRRTVTLQALSPERSALVVPWFSYHPTEAASLAEWVTRWSLDMVHVVTGLARGLTRGELGTQVMAVARALEGERFDLLPADARKVAAHLSGEWTGSALDLVHAALAITGDRQAKAPV